MSEPSLTLVRRFRASPQAVFDACTDPTRLRLWLGPARFSVTHLEADPWVGGRLWFRMTGPEGEAAVEGTFRVVEPPRLVVLARTWVERPATDPPLDAPTLVRFAIAPEGTGSRLTLTHERLPDNEAGSHAQGWAEALDKLAELLLAAEPPTPDPLGPVIQGERPMALTAIFANLNVSDLARSRRWYATLLGREPDAEPMEGLVEWHHGEGAGLQVSAEEAGSGKAGRGTLTLIVPDLTAEHVRLARLSPGKVEPGDYASLVRLNDPDGNLVVLAQPGRV